MPERYTRRVLLASVPMLAQAAGEEVVRLPKKVRVALLGMDGHIGEILSPLRRLPDAELVAVSDPNPAALAGFGRGIGFERVRQYQDYHQMLDTEEIDVVGVCNPNGSRAAVVIDCLERGLHVAAEKPLALTREALGRVRQALEGSDAQLTMLLPMRYSSPYLGIKRIVDSGEIGEVCQIASQKSYKAGDRPAWMRHRESYGGTIAWIGIHMIDLMRWTSGREFVQAFSYTSHIAFPEIGDMENVTASLFRLDNQGIAVLRMDYLRPDSAPTHGDDRLRIAGTAGLVEYQAASGVTVVSGQSKPRRLTDLPEGQSLFVNFLESVYLDKPRKLSIEDIFRVNTITIAAQEAAERKAAVDCG